MKLPNYKKAELRIEKLKEYCLNLKHPRGRHKAKVFSSVLGFSDYDAEELSEIILSKIVRNEAILRETDKYGTRYSVDMMISKENRIANVRTLWIIRKNEDFPRFVSCYIL